MPGDVAAYFDRHPRDYSPERLCDALAWIERRSPDRICDLGCGTGVALVEVARCLPEAELVAVDISETALATAVARVRCRPVLLSVLDPGLEAATGGHFDVVLMSAVLHHVVGPTRRASRRLAGSALGKALGLAGPGGVVVVVEPTFAPRRAATLVFWLKRVVTTCTDRRVELGRWNNIGAPVVSYYEPGAVAAMAADAGGSVAEQVHRARRVRLLPRLLGVRRRWESSYLIEPAGAMPSRPRLLKRTPTDRSPLR